MRVEAAAVEVVMEWARRAAAAVRVEAGARVAEAVEAETVMEEVEEAVAMAVEGRPADRPRRRKCSSRCIGTNQNNVGSYSQRHSGGRGTSAP